MGLQLKNDRRLDPEEQELNGLCRQRVWYLFCGSGGWINYGTKTFAKEMNCAGGERGNGLPFFAKGLLACIGSVCGCEGSKRNAGINGKCGGTRLKTGDKGACSFMCACGGLGASGALTRASQGGERGVMTKFNCPVMPFLQGNWWSNCKPSKCIVAWDSCLAVFGAFSWVGIIKFICGASGVHWGCCCSCIMLFPICALLVTLVLLFGSCGSWTWDWF